MRSLFVLFIAIACGVSGSLGQTPGKVFISVDMEGIGGIGTSKMTGSGGKDYQTGRRLMTDEVLAVIAALQSIGDIEILVNDSHGDMQNLLHTELPSGVRYIQGNIKPLGMVQGLDATFDAVIFIGYHARAGTKDGFLAHTGSGSVKGLWLNDVEVGEGGLNAAFAGAFGVPVVLASGDLTFTRQIAERVKGVSTVVTKEAIGNRSCVLYPAQDVRDALAAGVRSAFGTALPTPMRLGEPVRIRMQFADTTRADVLQAIPGMTRRDGYTVEVTTPNMDRAYRLIRLMYKYVAY